MAVKWFGHAVAVEPNSLGTLDSYFGQAVCYLKGGEPRRAVDVISKAIDLLQGVDLKREGFKYFINRYLRSICYRVLGMRREA